MPDHTPEPPAIPEPALKALIARFKAQGGAVPDDGAPLVKGPSLPADQVPEHLQKALARWRAQGGTIAETPTAAATTAPPPPGMGGRR